MVETGTDAVLEHSADRAHEALDRTLRERSPANADTLSRTLVRTADCGGDVARVALRASVRSEA